MMMNFAGITEEVNEFMRRQQGWSESSEIKDELESVSLETL